MGSLTILVPISAAPPTAANGARKPGILARLLRARAEASERRTLTHLASQSDERLDAMGFSRDDIDALRKGELRLPRR